MYNNISGKIKILAVIIFIMGAIVSLVEGIYFISHDMVLAGFIVIVVGPVLSWASSFLIYGFGEIIDTLHRIENNTHTKVKKIILNTKKHGAKNLKDDDDESYKPLDVSNFEIFK